MTYSEYIRRTAATLAMIVATIFAVLAIWNLSSILLTVFTCWVLAVGLDSLARRLQVRGVSRTASIILTLLASLITIVILIAIILPPFVQQIGNLAAQVPDLVESGIDLYGRVREEFPITQEFLPELTIDSYNDLISTDVANVVEAQSGINLESILGSALPVLQGVGSFVGGFIANLFIILMITLYILADPNVYYRAVIAMVPQAQEARAVRILNMIRESIIVWIGALVTSMTFIGITVTLALGVIFQIPNAVALGVLAALAGFIPNVGYYIAAIPMLLFTALDDPAKVIPVYLVYWVLNEVEGKIISPSIVKDRMSIPAGFILPFQLISATVFGFYGIILAVPIMAIILILIRELYVFDMLGKKGRVPQITQNINGEILLNVPLDQPGDVDGSRN